jgi:hypothetical protein
MKFGQIHTNLTFNYNTFIKAYGIIDRKHCKSMCIYPPISGKEVKRIL